MTQFFAANTEILILSWKQISCAPILNKEKK